MALWQAIILGVVQGLTEFLPVSSDGHLALAQLLIPGFSQPGLVFDVALHLGTVVSVVALEWPRVIEAVRSRTALRLASQLAVATVFTAAVALPLRTFAEESYQRPLVIAAGFAMTAVLLVLGRGAGGARGPAAMPWRTVALIGLVQGSAVLPGLSRSGSTIPLGLLCGLERRWAADFSFLLSVPAVLGAAFVEEATHHREVMAAAATLWLPALVGALVAGLTGAGAIVAVRRIVQGGRLHLFAMYLVPLAVVVALADLLGVW